MSSLSNDPLPNPKLGENVLGSFDTRNKTTSSKPPMSDQESRADRIAKEKLQAQTQAPLISQPSTAQPSSKLDNAREKLIKMNAGIHNPKGLPISRESAPEIFNVNPDLKFIAWESASKPGNISIWKRGREKPAVVNPNEFLAYMQEMDLESAREKLSKLNAGVQIPEGLSISRESAPEILIKNPHLKFIAWESVSDPGNFAVLEREKKKPERYRPAQFLAYMQKMETLQPDSSTGLSPPNLQTSTSSKAEAPKIKTPALKLDAEAMFRELAAKTKPGEVLNNSQVINAFKESACMCCKKGAVKVGDNEFLHANSITYKDDGYTHIAAQAPQKPEASERFWKTASSTPGNLIVDLTNDADLSKSPAIALNYPLPGQTQTFGSMQVKCKASEKEGDVTTSTYTIQQLDKEGQPSGAPKTVTRINYQGWHDFSGADAAGLKKLISIVDSCAPKDCIPIVHCRAGVGRTGTFITARTIEHLSKEKNEEGIPKINRNNLQEQMGNIVLNGRESRGPWFVQTQAQMETLVTFAQNTVK